MRGARPKRLRLYATREAEGEAVAIVVDGGGGGLLVVGRSDGRARYAKFRVDVWFQS